MAQQQTVPMPWSAATIASLANAIAQGAHTVEYSTDRGHYRVTYRSVGEMQGLLDRMVRYVNGQGDGVRPPNTRASVFISR